MKVYFVHKYTNVKISLDEIKNNKYYDFSFTDFNKSERIYNYRASDIPLSDDFEIEIVDDTFTAEELYKLYIFFKNWSLKDTLVDSKLADKLYNEFIKKRERRKEIKI